MCPRQPTRSRAQPVARGSSARDSARPTARVITQRILDGNQGLATGQPTIEIADSLFPFQARIPDERDQSRFFGTRTTQHPSRPRLVLH